MAGRIEYRIIKNKPNFNSNSQYYYNTELEEWYFQTGLESIAIGDDLYTGQNDVYYSDYNEFMEFSNLLGSGGSVINNNPLQLQSLTNLGENQESDFDYNYPPIDFRFVSNVYVGNDWETGVYLQKYHDLGSIDYIQSSAPNLVTLYFDMAVNDAAFELTDISQSDVDYYNFRWTVLDWDSTLNAIDDFENIVLPNSDVEYSAQRQTNNILIPADVFSNGGDQVCPPNSNIANETTCNMLQHEYNEPGIKTIKVLGAIWPKVRVPSGGGSGTSRDAVFYKFITIRIFLGLDGVFVEDFSEIGGPDYTFLPWPYEMTPVIGGLVKMNDKDGFGETSYMTKNSQYVKSLNKLVKSNKFDDRDILNQSLARTALDNDNIGVWPGQLDFAQTRIFMDGSYDLAKLLMIEDAYDTDKNFTGKLENHPFTDDFYWDGFINSFPDDSCVGEIFINDNKNYILRSLNIIEINGGEAEFSYVRDSSGNGNKGILFGDYAIKKDSKETPLVRQSDVDYPEIDTEDGAL